MLDLLLKRMMATYRKLRQVMFWFFTFENILCHPGGLVIVGNFLFKVVSVLIALKIIFSIFVVIHSFNSLPFIIVGTSTNCRILSLMKIEEWSSHQEKQKMGSMTLDC